MTPPGRHEKPPNAGRVAARIVMGLAGVALLVLGGFSYHSNRITFPDVVGLVACVVVYAVAALWLRREKGRQPETPGEPPQCPYGSCHHNHPELPERGEGGQP